MSYELTSALMPSLYSHVKSSTVKNISRRKLSCQSDFVSTPLGRWGAINRDEAILTPGGGHVRDRTGLPNRIANLIAELNGIGLPR